jgi:hypothetical protein
VLYIQARKIRHVRPRHPTARKPVPRRLRLGLRGGA